MAKEDNKSLIELQLRSNWSPRDYQSGSFVRRRAGKSVRAALVIEE